MIIKKIKELYNVDTISQDKGWKRVHEALPEGEEVMIDFYGTNVVDPWDCPEFKKLLKNPLVHMKFTNCDELVRRIKIMCVVEGMDEEHITNEVVEVPKGKTAEEKKIERIGTELVSSFVVEGTKATFVVGNRYSQMHSTNTLNYIKFAIDLLVETKGIKTVVLDFRGITILRHVTEFVSDIIIEYKTKDIDLLVETEDAETINDLKLFIHQATNKTYDPKTKAMVIKNNVPKNTAGILIKYKKSRALDEFGRHGNGEIVSSRVALLKEIVIENGANIAVIESFNNNYFYTPQHWLVEHDNEPLKKLKSDIVKIPMKELGYGDLFLGSQYHFLPPVQQDISENRVVITDIDEDGKNIKQTCTIPERIKLVFDSWSIEYNKEELEKAILATKELLESK